MVTAKPHLRMNLPFLKSVPNGVRLRLRIQPRASRDEVTGVHAETLKVRIKSAPVEGAANKALIKFLAKTLNVKRGELEIKEGLKGREKVVLVKGASIEDIKDALEDVLSKK